LNSNKTSEGHPDGFLALSRRIHRAALVDFFGSQKGMLKGKPMGFRAVKALGFSEVRVART